MLDKTAGAWSSGAIFIPASTASTIAGCKITGLRFGMSSLLGIDEAKAWIRTSLDGEDIAVKVLNSDSDSKLARGWNEVSFEEPWTVPEDCEGFYLGYSVHQKGISYGINTSPAPCGNALFVNMAGNGWEDLSSQGTLYLQATVEGENLPAVNLGVASCNLADQFFMNKDILSGTFRVHNLGAQSVSAFEVSLMDGDTPLSSAIVNTSLVPGESKEIPVDFTVAFPEAGIYNLTFKVDNIAEGDDADMTDNVRNQEVHVMGGALERIVLVEEFSTEKCNNCPRAAGLLESIVEREANKGRIAAVVHHSGYYTDFLTQLWDNDYLWFFNGATGCPNFMVDRYTETSPTPIVAEANLDAAITSRLQDEPVLLLDMKAGFDITNDSRLVVEVCGTKFSRDPICDEPYITLWLTENNVAAKNQQGSSGNFKHQHVTRALNSTWGQPVLFEGDNFEYTYVFEDVDPSWKTADLVVVGAVHEKKGTNRTGMAVANACFKGYDDFEAMSAPSGADRVAVEGAQAEEEYYTLAGLRVSPENLAPGLYIRRCGEKTEKVLVR